jgi:hypothetical protein
MFQSVLQNLEGILDVLEEYFENGSGQTSLGFVTSFIPESNFVVSIKAALYMLAVLENFHAD